MSEKEMLAAGMAIGVLGFGFGFVWDVAQLKQRVVWERVALTAFLAATAVAIIILASHPWKLEVATPLRWASAFLAALFLVLLSYSTLLEIPLRLRGFPQSSTRSLVRRGTYALCRHPGALWLPPGVVALAVGPGVSRSASDQSTVDRRRAALGVLGGPVPFHAAVSRVQ